MLAPFILASALAAWPAPLKAAVEAESAPSPLAFTMSAVTNGVKMVGAYDGKTWTLKEPAGRALTKPEKDALEALKRSNPQRDLACATRAETIPAQVALKSESADEYVYAYQPVLGPKTPKQLASGMAHTSAEIRVAKASGRIVGGRTWLKAAYSPAPLTKLNAYTEQYDCAVGPSGATLTTRSHLTLDISALGSKRAIERTAQLTDIRALK